MTDYAVTGFISRLGRPVCRQFEVCLWLAWPLGGAEAICEAERRVRYRGRLNSCWDESEGRQRLVGLGGLWASWKKTSRRVKRAKVKGSRRWLAVFCQAGKVVRHLCSLSTTVLLQPVGHFVDTEGLLPPKLGSPFKVKSGPMEVQSKKEQKIIYKLWNPNTLRTLITDTHQRHFSPLAAIATYKYPHSKLCCASWGACVSDRSRAACVRQASLPPNISFPGRRAAFQSSSIKLASYSEAKERCLPPATASR